MSRSGYSDDLDSRDLAMWRGRVASATRGQRGQRLFRELAAAMDAMPEKALIADSLVDADGDFCALGVVGKARGVDVTKLDAEDPAGVGEAFDIASCLAQEIVYMNDEWGSCHETPAERWARMRRWVASQIKEQTS